MIQRSDITHHSQPLKKKENRQTMDIAQNDFKNILRSKVSGLKEVSSLEQCQVILSFCTITSRAGTDIDTAMNLLNQVKASMPVIVVVLHHTSDHEKIVLDSNNVIESSHKDTFAVDCLFYENMLLRCQKNEDAIDKTAKYFKSKNLTSFYCLNNQDAENYPVDDGGSGPQPNSRQDDTCYRICCCFSHGSGCVGN